MRWDTPPPLPIPDWLPDYLHNSGLKSAYIPILQQLIAHIKPAFQNPAELDRFLHPSLKDTEPPSSIQNLQQAVTYIHQACQSSKRIAIASDYDVDGVTSMALMHRFFKYFKQSFTPLFPLRATEGYGLTPAFIDRISAAHPPFDLLIALDCGTNATGAIRQLNNWGTQVIVIDHHEPTVDPLPPALIVNPYIHPELHSESARSLCTAGLVFKCLHYWRTLLKGEGVTAANELVLRSFLDFVALGTIADVVPLRGDNRLWVHFGLKALPQTPSRSLKTLLDQSGCTIPPTVDDIGFKIGPRLNAGGRLDSATLPFELLTTEDPAVGTALAYQLDTLNAQRQQLEQNILQEAEALIANHSNQKAYVLYQPHWHVGVVGIVAGRLARKYHCPIFVLGKQGESGLLAKGSGRSIPGIDFVKVLSQTDPGAWQWGGHEAAVGISVEIDQIAPFEQGLRNTLARMFPIWPERSLTVAAVLPDHNSSSDSAFLSEAFLQELERLGPFGQENEMPLFGLQGIQLLDPPEYFGSHKKHMRFRWKAHTLIAWNYSGPMPPVHQPIDLVIQLGWHYWAHQSTLQIQLIDWRPSKPGL